ncbi:MAG: PorT family protein [Ignavibacteriales bacterium]|nr:PorT family protein [Ignavibacteriales bacterium]
MPRPAAADVQFGIKAGGNMAKPTGADADDFAGHPEIQGRASSGGIFLAFNFGRVVTIQSEVLYTMKGATSMYTALDDTYTDKLYADYIEIPLLLKLKIPTPVVQPFVFAGPSVGFKLKEKLEVDGEEIPLEEAILKNNDYGAIFGAGLNLGRNFMLDVRYSLGLQKVISTFEGEVRAGLQERRLVGQRSASPSDPRSFVRIDDGASARRRRRFFGSSPVSGIPSRGGEGIVLADPRCWRRGTGRERSLRSDHQRRSGVTRRGRRWEIS